MEVLSSQACYHRTYVPLSPASERIGREKKQRPTIFGFRDVWSYYLPLVQRILNYTIDGFIGTQPAREILGDLATSCLAMDVLAHWSGRNVEDNLVKLREGQAT